MSVVISAPVLGQKLIMLLPPVNRCIIITGSVFINVISLSNYRINEYETDPIMHELARIHSFESVSALANYALKNHPTNYRKYVENPEKAFEELQ